MLRESVTLTSTALDPRAITDRTLDPLLPGGAVLLTFVDAVLLGDSSEASRAAVLATLGPAGLVDAAAVIANFEMMNRIADATGMPVATGHLQRTEEWRRLLDLDRFNHL